MTKFNSTYSRIKKIVEITKKRYEPGNQSKCYKAVWRKYIQPEFGICYRTYMNYLSITLKAS